MKRTYLILGILVLIFTVIVIHMMSRHVGRSRADIAALFSIDDGLFGFSQEYSTGTVGPFTINQSKRSAIDALSTQRSPFILPMAAPEYRTRFYLTENSRVSQDMRQYLRGQDEWSVAITSENGGHISYSVKFSDQRIKSVRSYYSIFAGL